MKIELSKIVPLLVLTLSVGSISPGLAQPEAGANSNVLPKQILKTGININSTTLSLNTQQLADNLKLSAFLEDIENLREKVKLMRGTITLETLSDRQDLTEATQQALAIIQEANLSVDFVLAEIEAEQNLTAEVLSSLSASRDRLVNWANETSFIANGALWATGEGFDIPTFRYPKYSIPSGTVSILAGVIPSFASLYAMKISSGKRLTSESDPNMLAKVFDENVTLEVDYPKAVWDFLSSVPPGDSRSRKDQLIDRWISDSNIPSFTNRKSKAQIDVITASVSHRKGLSIDMLNTRHVMLQQLSAEVMKMKRMLLELTMVICAEKHV